MNNSVSDSRSFDVYVSSIMRKVYVKMFLALIVTAFTAFVCSGSSDFMNFMVSNSWAYWGLMILEIGMVFALAGAINKLSNTSASLLFYGYSIINGMVLSIIFLVYTMSSIWQTFAITAGVFGAMSIYGYFTKEDLTKFGSYLYMALFGLIIAIVVNIFLANSMLDWIISFAGVAIFIGLTAWDTQKIKKMAAMSDSSNVGRVATLGALSLYLDFVNLFLYLLRFFGSSRN